MPDVTANGINVHYEERGRGDPLVLIMGLGADGALWEDHVAACGAWLGCVASMDSDVTEHQQKYKYSGTFRAGVRPRVQGSRTVEV